MSVKTKKSKVPAAAAVVAAAEAEAKPAAMGGATEAEFGRAEKMLDRLEAERIKADETLKQQAEHLSRVIGLLRFADNKGLLSLAAAAGPAQAPAQKEEYLDNGITSYFEKRASIETVLAVRLLNDLICVCDFQSPLIKQIRKIIDRRLDGLNFEDSDSYGANVAFLAGAIAGTRE